jgi:hypothetical protein
MALPGLNSGLRHPTNARRSMIPVRTDGLLKVPFRQPPRYTISGVTKDSAGVALGAVSIEVYEIITGTPTGNEPKGRLVGQTVSDANGNYRVDVYSAVGVTFQVDAYKSGAPDVAGTTVNTLVGTPT